MSKHIPENKNRKKANQPRNISSTKGEGSVWNSTYAHGTCSDWPESSAPWWSGKPLCVDENPTSDLKHLLSTKHSKHIHLCAGFVSLHLLVRASLAVEANNGCLPSVSGWLPLCLGLGFHFTYSVCSACSCVLPVLFFRLLGLVGGSVCSAALAGPPLCCCSTFLLFVSGLFGVCRWLFCCSIFFPHCTCSACSNVLSVLPFYRLSVLPFCLHYRSTSSFFLFVLPFHLFFLSVHSSFFYRSTVLPILPFLPTCLFSLRQGASSKGKIHFACKLHGSGGQWTYPWLIGFKGSQ